MWYLIILIALLIPLIAVILDSQLGRALAARIEGRDDDSPDVSSDRFAGLEAEIERLSREVQRLQEESEFLRELLEDRTPSGRSLPPGE